MGEEKVHNITLEILVNIRDEVRQLRQEITNLHKELREFKEQTRYRFREVGQELDLIESRLKRCLCLSDELEELRRTLQKEEQSPK